MSASTLSSPGAKRESGWKHSVLSRSVLSAVFVHVVYVIASFALYLCSAWVACPRGSCGYCVGALSLLTYVPYTWFRGSLC